MKRLACSASLGSRCGVTGAPASPDPAELTDKEQVDQLFAPDHIRSLSEQQVYAAQQRNKKQHLPSKVGVLTIDLERRGANCGKKFIPLADLKAAVRLIEQAAKVAGPS